MASKFSVSHRTGWLMAGPAFGLMVLFILIPFVFAIALSFTNQRLISPNPTEFVGLSNYSQLLGMGVLSLDPVTDANGAVVMKDGAPEYPGVRGFTRNNPDYPQYGRGCANGSAFPFGGDTQPVVLASRCGLHEGGCEHLPLRAVRGPYCRAAWPLALRLLINQRLRGINVVPDHLFHAGGCVDRRRVDPVEDHL